MMKFKQIPSCLTFWASSVLLFGAMSASAQKPTTDTENLMEAKSTAEEAQSENDQLERKPLSDRIKAVERKAFLKRERISLFPKFGVDLNDAFFTHLILGGGMAYHLADPLAIEVQGGVVLASIKQDAIRFTRRSTDALLQNVPKFKWHAEADLVWTPIYGKISLFGEAILHFDTYIAAGGGAFATDSGIHPAVNVGIGQRYFLTDWLAFRLEFRDYIFLDSRDGQSDVQNILMLNALVSVFFPTAFDYEYQ